MRALLTMLVLLFAATVSAAFAQTPYDGVSETSIYLPSFDGTRLAITITRPTRAGKTATEKLPVIVTQDRRLTSMPRFAGSRRFFSDNGYILVAQDRRGTGASFGRQTGFVNAFDARDAKAVIEWAGAQSFSNGKVVAMGCSNQGAWQYMAAALAPKHLVAIAPACASPQFFDHAVTVNGVPMFKLGAAPYAGHCTATPPGDGMGLAPAKPVDADSDGTLLAAAREEQRCGAPMLGQYWLNMPRDGFNNFARERPGLVDSAITHWDKIKASEIAILQIGGWYDAATIGQFEGQRLWGGRVLMGPWVHANGPPPGSAFPNAQVDFNAVTLAFFDHYAKGVANGADKPGVRYYVVNAPAGSEWRETPVWRAGDKTRHYLTADGLGLIPGGARGASIVYQQQDVRWFEGKYAPLAHWWAGDMSLDDARSIVHETAAFTADRDMIGTPSARLWISADAPDVNVFAVIEDVGPDGKSQYVTDGRLRASWRKVGTAPGGSREQHWHPGYAADITPLEIGKPTELVFDFYPIAYVFKAGHKLRVSLATSLGEDYQAPPLAGGKAPTLTLYRDARRRSAVDLPMR